MIPRHRREGAVQAFVVLGVMGIALGMYRRTLAPGLVWGDGPELAAVAKSLGIAHPTGYPFFTLVTHVWLWLPLGGSVAWRTHLLCAVFSAATAALLVVLLTRWRRDLPEQAAARDPFQVLAVAGGMAYAFALGPWSHATLTEVYPLQVLLQTATILAAWHTVRSGRGLPGLALLFSLALGHHLLAIVLLPLVGVAAWRVLGPETHDHPDRLRQAAVGLGSFGIGLLPLLYLPLRAAQRPAINWGDPSTLERWLGHLRGGHYIDELWLTGQPGTPFRGGGDFGLHLLDRLRAITGYVLGQVLPPEGLPPVVWVLPLLVGGLALMSGLWRLAEGSRPFAWGMGGSIGLYLGVVSTYNIHDIVDYQLGLVALLWPVAWLGIWELAVARPGGGSVSSWARRLPPPARGVFLMFLLLLPLALLMGHFRVSDRSEFDLGDRYADRLLASLPPDAVLVTRGQYATSSAWYQQEALGQRRDVRVVVQDFLAEPWYADSLAGRDFGGLTVPPAADDAGPGMATVATLEALVAANPGASIFLLASPRQKVLLDRLFLLAPHATLLDADEIGEAFEQGFEPPEARLFRIVGPVAGLRGQGP